MPGTNLEPRTVPVQQRSKDTVERILETAAELLDEVGVGELTTNLLADRAGIRVRTIYRYFPNKLAIITALAERLARVEQSFVDGFLTVADGSGDWRVAFDGIIDRYLVESHKVSGLASVRHTLHAVPDLRHVEAEINRRLAAGLARALRSRGVELPAKHMRALTRTIIETSAAIVELSRGHGKGYARELVDELKLMQKSYLANYLD